MSTRASAVIGWICNGLVAAFFLFSAVMKFVPQPPEAAVFMERLGTTGMEHQLGILQLIILALFLIPRTSVVGLILMVGYLGGALATNLTHAFTFMEAMPVWVSLILMAIGAWFRQPELSWRLRGKAVTA